MNEPDIGTRRELFAHLEHQMDASYRELLGSGRLQHESTFLKTYLLEKAPDSPWEADARPEALAQLFTVPASSMMPDIKPRVRETEEDGLFVVRWLTDRPITLYLDTTSSGDERFWVAHSLGDAGALDRAVRRITSTNPSIDRVWFWPDFLQSAQGLGEFRGVGVSYDRRKVEKAQGIEDPDDFLSIQLLGGSGTEDILRFLQGHEKHGAHTVVSRISLKVSLPDGDGFAREDIYREGKFTARGSSFLAHQVLVTRLLDAYASTVRSIEREYLLRQTASPGLGISIDGSPVYFVVEDGGTLDVDALCEVAFSGYQPFRLWGMPRAIPSADDGREALVTDLHTGSRMYFEIYPDAIAMYLYGGACGNSVVRFYANLQEAIGCDVRMEDDNGRRLLQPERFEPGDRPH